MNKMLNKLKSFELNKRNKIKSNKLMFDIIQSSTDQKPRIKQNTLPFCVQLLSFKNDFDVQPLTKEIVS